jgi:small redox-active disulfide protein 2
MEDLQMKIQIAGPGCPKCEETEKHVREACAQTGLHVEIETVRDVDEIARLGVKLTPGVIVDGHVIESGPVPTVSRLKQALTTLVRTQRARDSLKPRT